MRAPCSRDSFQWWKAICRCSTKWCVSVPTPSSGRPRDTCCNTGPRGRKPKVITDALQYALRDQEDIVRNNALRALGAAYIGAKLHPEQDVAIEPAWLVEMLNSVVWSDRRHAAQILVDLTEDRKSDALGIIRERALPSDLEMARWQTLDHALPAFILAALAWREQMRRRSKIRGCTAIANRFSAN